MTKRREYIGIAVLSAVVFAGFFVMSFQRAAAQFAFDMPNELIDASQATNRRMSDGAVIGNRGYVVVGTGEYSSTETGMTILSPVPNVRVRIEHGNHCGNMSPGSFTGVDAPLPNAATTTTFVVVDRSTRVIFGPAANQPALMTGGNNCGTLDLTTGVLDLELMPDGRYGGLVAALMNVSGAGSQQNSFRVVVLDAAGNQLETADVGFNPEVVDRMSPVIGRPGITSLAMSIANSDLPRYALTDFGLPFTLDCGAVVNNVYVPLTFYDVDQNIWQNVNLNGNFVPSVAVVLESSPIGANSWTAIGMWGLDYDGSDGAVGDPGNAGSITIGNFGPFVNNRDYRVRVNNIYRANALQFSVNSDDLRSGSRTTCAVPTCDITSVVGTTTGNVVFPGDQFRFNVTTADASGYVLGVNGPAWGNPGAWGNFIVNGNQYIRSPVNPSGGNTVTAFRYGDSGAFNEGFYATSTGTSSGTPLAPGSYPFNWGLVIPGVGWAADTCSGTLIVTAPDVPPTITITQNCAVPFTITINVNDPNYSTNAGNPQINYTIGGVAQPTITARSHTFNMPGGGISAVSVTANSFGVNPSPPGGLGTKNGSASANFDPCGYPFTVSSQPQLPSLDDSELPTSASFVSFITLSGTATRVNGGPNGINTEREFFFNRGGTYDAVNGTLTGTGSLVLNPVVTTNGVGLPATGSNNVLGVQNRSLVLPGYLPTFQAGDYICSRLTISPASGLVDLAGNIITGTTSGSSVRKICITITDKPYVKVFGSDVLAGSGFGSTCSGIPNANITAFARNTGGGWVGGGTQFGVFAGGVVSGFASNSIAAPASPSSRVFANTGALGSVFGGLFGSSTCADDFWASKSTSVGVTATVPLSSLSSATPIVAPGQYQFAPGSNISAAAAINGKIAVFVDGDATITSNITTSTGPWASTAAIPSVYLVVRGNIYIAPNVTRLDGIYVAMPRVPASNIGTPADGGRIFTCTDNGAAPTNAALLGACRTNRLVVNGAFTAKHVNLLRTGGSLRGATTAAVPQPATCTAANPVTIYTDYKFLGTSRTLAAGSYVAGAATAPVGYRQISSVKVPAGCRAVLLDETTGQSKDLYADWTVVDGSSPFNDATTRIDVTSIPVSQRQLGLLWSTTGPIEPANYDCALFNEPSDSWWTGVYADNYLCARRSYALGLAFSANGPIPGRTCVLVNEAGDPNGWANNYLCTNANLGLQFTGGGGTIGIAGMYCTSAVYEPGDTHMPLAWWLDNFMCEPLAPVPASPAIIGETSASTNIAEIFNFTPDMLMAVPSPTTKQTIGSFDSVISLPPSL